MKWLKISFDVILSMVMIPFILIGLGLCIGMGVVHFIGWWIKRTKNVRKAKKQKSINYQ